MSFSRGHVLVVKFLALAIVLGLVLDLSDDGRLGGSHAYSAEFVHNLRKGLSPGHNLWFHVWRGLGLSPCKKRDFHERGIRNLDSEALEKFERLDIVKGRPIESRSFLRPGFIFWSYAKEFREELRPTGDFFIIGFGSGGLPS